MIRVSIASFSITIDAIRFDDAASSEVFRDQDVAMQLSFGQA